MSNRDAFDPQTPEVPEWLSSMRPADASALQASVFYRAGEQAGYEAGLQAARRERMVLTGRQSAWAAAGLLLAAGIGFGLFQLGARRGERLAMAELQSPAINHQPAPTLDEKPASSDDRRASYDAIAPHANSHGDSGEDGGEAESAESMDRGNLALSSGRANAPVAQPTVRPTWVSLWWQHYVQPALTQRQKTVAWVSTHSSWESLDAVRPIVPRADKPLPTASDNEASDAWISPANELPLEREFLEFQPANPLKTWMSDLF